MAWNYTGPYVMRTHTCFIVIASGALLGSCQKEPANAPTPAGTASSGPPTRVVCLSCAAVDIFTALGELDRVIAVEEDCPAPGTEGKLKIRNDDHPGKLAAFNVESVLALHPDAVIAQPDLKEALSNRDLRVVWSPDHYSYDNIHVLPERIGELLGMQDRVRTLLQHMHEKEAQIRARTAQLPKVTVYYETTGVGWTIGNQGVMNAMIELAGGRNIARDIPKANTTITPEAIFAADPEVIVLGAFADTVEEVKARPGWDKLRAVRTNQVYHIPIERRNVAQGTPRCVDECDSMLLPWLHPELATPPAASH